jgi:hypothetical protein
VLNLGIPSHVSIIAALKGVNLIYCAVLIGAGGGYKVARMPHEPFSDIQLIGAPVKEVCGASESSTSY